MNLSKIICVFAIAALCVAMVGCPKKNGETDKDKTILELLKADKDCKWVADAIAKAEFEFKADKTYIFVIPGEVVEANMYDTKEKATALIKAFIVEKLEGDFEIKTKKVDDKDVKTIQDKEFTKVEAKDGTIYKLKK